MTMSNEHPHTAMSKAFRETALNLIGLYQIYEVNPDLSAATAEVMRAVFWRHLRQMPPAAANTGRSPLHDLADELGRMGGCSGSGERR